MRRTELKLIRLQVKCGHHEHLCVSSRKVNNEPLCDARPLPEAGERSSDPWALVRSQLQRTAGAAQEKPVPAWHVSAFTKLLFTSWWWLMFVFVKRCATVLVVTLSFGCAGSCRIHEWWPHCLCCWTRSSLKGRKMNPPLLLLLNLKKPSHLLPKRKTFLKIRGR